MPGEVALEEYSSPVRGFAEGELAIGLGTPVKCAEGKACVGLAEAGGGRMLDEWGPPGVGGVEESRLTLEGRFPSLVAGARLVSRPGPSSVAIVLCGSSQQPARRNVAWMVSQGM